MKFTDEDGKVWDFRGVVREPRWGCGDEWFVTSSGVVKARASGIYTYLAAIVHPVPKVHEFGGVKFEETGEERSVTFDEWFLNTASIPFGEVWRQGYNSTASYIVLRPLQGEK